jgi:hypothetical protein
MNKGVLIVRKYRGTYLVGGAALAASLAFAMPAMVNAAFGDSDVSAGSVDLLMGQFTPANGDPKLMAAYSKLSAADRRAFEFTPALQAAAPESQAMTLVVRSAPTLPGAAQLPQQQAVAGIARADSVAAPIAIAPIRYSLGSAIGYDRFAMSTAKPAAPAITFKGNRIDIDALPQAKAPTGGPKSKPSRFGGDMKLAREALPGSDPRLLNPEESYSVDLSGRYKVSKNFDVTAGVRLKQENDRLQPLTNAQQDSQAVYVGTRVKF